MNRPKVSLITLHRVKNYGSVLQAYATQQLLLDAGAMVEVVDYWRPDLTDAVDDYFERSRWSRFGFLRLPFRVLKAPWIERNHVVFNDFIETEFKLGPLAYKEPGQLVANPPQADIYCVGSDQVWNNDYNVGGSDPFFLTFAPAAAPRIAFSSSFGHQAVDSVSRRLSSDELPKFSSISVREQSGADFLKELGIDSITTVDPTLAIEPHFWESFGSSPADPGKRIIVYQLGQDRNFDRVVKQVENSLGAAATRIDIRSSGRSSTRRVRQPTLRDWVSLFRYAEHIVTDSFHGTAFALIFNVPVTVVLPGAYGERLRNLLKLAGLLDRIVTPGGELPMEQIDWDHVNSRIGLGRRHAQDYLRTALSQALAPERGDLA